MAHGCPRVCSCPQPPPSITSPRCGWQGPQGTSSWLQDPAGPCRPSRARLAHAVLPPSARRPTPCPQPPLQPHPTTTPAEVWVAGSPGDPNSPPPCAGVARLSVCPRAAQAHWSLAPGSGPPRPAPGARLLCPKRQAPYPMRAAVRSSTRPPTQLKFGRQGPGGPEQPLPASRGCTALCFTPTAAQWRLWWQLRGPGGLGA